jgi:serine/threonine protein kinase
MMMQATPAGRARSGRQCLFLSLILPWILLLGAVLACPAPALAQVKTGPGIAKKSGGGLSFQRLLMYAGGAIGGLVVVAIIVYVIKNRPEAGPMTTAQSDIISGYRLQNLMNTGQTSQVWEVVETSSGRHFAMKFLLPEKVHDQEYRQLLFHEAEVGMKLAHPNVIKIVKLDKNVHNPYFVMEYFPGGSLQRRVMHKQWDFIKPKAMEIFKQAATALAYMNATGFVHRDVKPDNLMVNSAGELRLIDFALAVRVSKKGMFSKKADRAAGTKSYMSPEQIRGEWLDGRADIYSFGATCFEVVTGRPPFRAASPTELLKKQIVEKALSPKVYNPDVTDQFADLVLRMLAKKREERPKDFHEVLMAMRSMQVFKTGVSTTKTE